MNLIDLKYENGKLIVPGGVTWIDNHKFMWNSKITALEIPDGIERIGREAFRYCRNLTSVTIPDSVTNIEESAFSCCDSLSSIIVSEGNRNYKSINNCCLSKDGDVLIFGCKDSKIPICVTKIKAGAFQRCTGLTAITIPDSVAEIGDGAFMHCSSIKSINIPNRVTRIGYDAFFGCSGLTAITIPDSVAEIGDGAFSNCSSITSIEIQAFFVDYIKELSPTDGFTSIIIRITEKLPDNSKDVLRIVDYLDPSIVTLKVPVGCEEAYRHHPDFIGKYKEIQEELD